MIRLRDSAIKLLKVFDPALVPVTWAAASTLLLMRRLGGDGLHRLPLCQRTLRQIGVFPVRDHYYEPFVQPAHLYRPLDAERNLPAINFNDDVQLAWLRKFRYCDELVQLPVEVTEADRYYYNNGYFESGDAEFFYSLIRCLQPHMIIEIGGGFSSLIADDAIRANRSEDPGYECRHVCIEPFEHPWLAELDIELVRTPIERCEPALFGDLSAGDILFIDSSHVIRPQGDVVFEYLELLPSLPKNVFVHIHDIFTPRDYLESWVIDRVLFWNEQYLVEAFLSFNSSFEVIGAVNYLKRHYPDELKAAFPVLARQFEAREPGSLWLRKTH
jgi:hypothetical protein